VSPEVTLLEWPWEIVRDQSGALAEDWNHTVGSGAILGDVDGASHIPGAEAVHIGPGTQVKPCVVIDAGKGSVWIGRQVEILPHAYVEGPAFIGDGSRLQPGAVVRESFIGPGCRIGGEVDASIVQSYSNKQHGGFLGHSYVGSWVNVAADCVSSDLKNTYGSVRVPVNGCEVDSGEQFVGIFVGDHSKIGTNVAFSPGAVVGFCSSVATSRIPKFVPSFSWIDGDKRERYAGDRGLEVARKAMARRGMEMGAAAERVFLEVSRQARDLEYVEEL
jgi:UDP-N-acetylglucosamine diphosphorylase/glucosamine-1-phosphate N-acetyltransferase